MAQFCVYVVCVCVEGDVFFACSSHAQPKGFACDFRTRAVQLLVCFFCRSKKKKNGCSVSDMCSHSQNNMSLYFFKKNPPFLRVFNVCVCVCVCVCVYVCGRAFSSERNLFTFIKKYMYFFRCQKEGALLHVNPFS